MKKIIKNLIRKLPKIIFNIIMLYILMFGIYYIAKIETKKYASNSIILVKNLSSQVDMANSLTSIITQGTTSTKDAYLLTVYLRSWDMYKNIDKDFNLTKYYTSKDIDFINRLEENSTIPFKKLDQENLLKAYNNDLSIEFDSLSSSIIIEFAHKDPKIAKNIVEKMILLSNQKLNYIDRENSKKSLIFFEQELKEKRQKFLENYKNIIKFQNKYKTISPSMDIEKYSKILADLESQLIETNIEYQNKKKFYPPASDIVKELKQKVVEIKQNIQKVKSKMVGNKRKINKENLSKYEYRFNLLKQKVDISKQLYIQALLSYDRIKEKIKKNSKNIIIVSNPTLPDEYKYPQILKEIFIYMFIYVFIYAIILGVIKIIEDHRE